jgi:hypothetical protein
MTDNVDLEKMCILIETFTKDDHIKILKIIKECETATLSENNNGTFINVEELSNDTIEKIKNYVKYVQMKEEEIKQIEDTKDKLKNDINVNYNFKHVETK